jgi:hypothetical protein
MNQPPSSGNDQLANHDFLYYQHPLPYPLSLRTDLLTSLKAKAHDLAHLYNTRLDEFNHYVNSIQTLWEELNVPDGKRCTIYHSLKKDNLVKVAEPLYVMSLITLPFFFYSSKPTLMP